MHYTPKINQEPDEIDLPNPHPLRHAKIEFRLVGNQGMDVRLAACP